MVIKVFGCTCAAWLESWPQIEKAQILAYQVAGAVYTGQVFKFCPWCSEALRIIEVAEPKVDKQEFCKTNCRWLSPTIEERTPQTIKAMHRCTKFDKELAINLDVIAIYRLTECDEP